MSAPVLPDLEAPAFNAHQPALSYKLAFADTTSWYASLDGGATKHSIQRPCVAGAVVDLALEISPAQDRDGEDHRLRVAFIEPTGRLAELNLNAVSLDRDGNAYITSPARSLAGALLVISEAEDDMRRLCAGARFTINPGRGRGVFVEVDVACGSNWITISGAPATLSISKVPDRFLNQLEQVKANFRSAGLLLPGPAIVPSRTQPLPAGQKVNRLALAP
ncbi:MAG: hypothetical protein WBN89_12880 [Prochlorococcaceae cyanobacterium]